MGTLHSPKVWNKSLTIRCCLMSHPGHPILGASNSFAWRYSQYILISLPRHWHNVCLINPFKEAEEMINILPWWASENCNDEMAQKTINRTLRGKDTCSHSKVEHCYRNKWRLCWEVGMWSTEEQLHFYVYNMFLCR